MENVEDFEIELEQRAERIRIMSLLKINLDRWHSEFDEQRLEGDYSLDSSFIYNRDYKIFICKKIGIVAMTCDIVNLLLSQTRKDLDSLLNIEVGLSCNFAMDVVETSMKYRFALEQKRWKNDNGGNIDLIWFSQNVRKLLDSASGGRRYAVDHYLRLKKIEFMLLQLRHEFVMQEEEQRRRLREEQKALKELKREKEQAEKDAAKAQAAIEKNEAALAKAKTNTQVKKLQAQIQELKIALQRAEERRDRAISMAQQTRCGYVYIISNIGSFGEGIYKIGLTRRLDPMDRVRELGDASVPFPFDVHTFIYSEDAPGLEAALHRKFQDRKVNSVNYRKEYFRVSLDEIREEVSRLGIVCEWVERPAAAQWRESKGVPQEYHYEFNPFEEE